MKIPEKLPEIDKNLTPAEREKQKTAEQRAEDIAYTINHSLYCTATDFLNPPINTMAEEFLPGIFSKIIRFFVPGCGHDHSKDHKHGHDCDHGHNHKPHEDHKHGAGCGHDHHEHHEDHAPKTPKSKWDKVKASMGRAFSGERFWSWCKGEFIGDFGAVPLTIAVQRWFPGFMHGVRKTIEPVMRPIFRWGVERSSKQWAADNGIEINSKEYKDHVATVYEHEMSHLPQAAVWTGFAVPLNVGYQMIARGSDKKMGFWPTVLNRTASCIVSMGVTAGVVVSARTAAPHKMQQLDRWTSRNVILPATKTVGKVFGVKKEDVERMVEKEKQFGDESWTERTHISDAERSR